MYLKQKAKTIFFFLKGFLGINGSISTLFKLLPRTEIQSAFQPGIGCSSETELKLDQPVRDPF